VLTFVHLEVILEKKQEILDEMEQEQKEFENRTRTIQVALANIEKKELLFRYTGWSWPT
jgi:hypothetical protein